MSAGEPHGLPLRPTRVLRRLCLSMLLLCAACSGAEPAEPPAAAARCDEAPRVHVSGGRTLAGTPVAAGVLVRACGEPVEDVPVRLQGRVVGAPQLEVLESGTTDAQGRAQWVLTRDHSAVLVGEADVAGKTVTSEQAVLAVATRVEVDVERVDGCRLALEGRTVPPKPGNIIGVLAQDGSARYATLLANRDGVFRGTFDFPCDKPVRLNVTSGPSVTNEEGSSYERPLTTLPEPRTCGRHEHDPEPLRDGLRQEVLVPASTVQPGHGWSGWLSVTNTSEEPRTVDPVEREWRLTLAGRDDLVAESSDARWGLYDPRDEPQELHPGEVLLRPFVLPAMNCFPPGGQSSSLPTYQLPVGDYDLGVVRGDDWHSETVRLRVASS